MKDLVAGLLESTGDRDLAFEDVMRAADTVVGAVLLQLAASMRERIFGAFNAGAGALVLSITVAPTETALAWRMPEMDPELVCADCLAMVSTRLAADLLIACGAFAATTLNVHAVGARAAIGRAVSTGARLRVELELSPRGREARISVVAGARTVGVTTVSLPAAAG